jgi:hypothetical protein
MYPGTNLLLLGFGNTWSKVGLSGNYEKGGKGFLSIPFSLLVAMDTSVADP